MSFSINLTDNPFLQQRHLSQAQNGAHYYAPSKTTVSLLCRVPAALLKNNAASAALKNALAQKDIKKIDESYIPKESSDPKVKKSSEYKIEEVLKTSIDENPVSEKSATSRAAHHKDLKIDLLEDHFGVITSADFYEVEVSENEKQ